MHSGGWVESEKGQQCGLSEGLRVVFSSGLVQQPLSGSALYSATCPGMLRNGPRLTATGLGLCGLYSVVGCKALNQNVQQMVLRVAPNTFRHHTVLHATPQVQP